jgi:gliding motility-associated-like protein
LINVLWGNGTTGSVTLKVTNAFLCDSTVVKNIIINTNPDAHITGVNSVCVHTSHIYQSNALTATTHKWTVTGGNIIGSDTLSSLNVKWNTTGLGILTYRGVNAALCDTVVNYTITVNPKPISAVTGNDSVCLHTTAWYYTPKQGTNTYQWQCSGGTILQQLDTAVFVRWHTIGAGWISVQETNSFNCDSTQIYPVRVLGKPMPGLAGKLQLCQHESGEYFVPKQNNVTVVWFASGFPMQNINDTTIRVYWNANGAYQVRAQVVDNLGCDTSSNVLVTVHPKPYQNFNGGNMFCSYKTINYNTIKRAGYTYEWTAIGGKIIGANNDTAVTVKWGDSTFASITLKSINPTGCDSSTTWIVTLLKAPTGQILGDSVICSNVNPNHYSIPAQPNYSYFWTAQLGGFSSTNISDQVDVNWQTPGFNNLRVRVYDNITGCDSNFNKVVYVDSIVKPVIDMQPKNGCVPFTTQMLASNLTNLGYTYVWLSGDGKKYTSANPTHTYLNAGVYPVQLKVTNANGCTDSSQTTVIANIQPKASLTYSSPTVKIYVEDTVTFYNHSTNANAYLWKLNNHTQDSTFSWMHLFELPGNYKIMLVAVDTLTGCIDSNYLRLDVRVHENVYVPNIFTPNNDGKNDFFSVGFENLASFEVIIANRWGQIIYTSTDPNFSWDGTFGGKPCQDDAYVYLITATGVQGKTFSLTGNVTLLR